MIMFLLALLGGFIGVALLPDVGGFVVGAVIGALIAQLHSLGMRLQRLERRLDAQKTAVASATRETRDAPPATSVHAAATPPAASTAPSATAPSPAASVPSASLTPTTAASTPSRRAERPRSVEPSAAAVLLGRIARWFTTGNVPVKVGVVLSLFGVGFLVKEGMDRQWFTLPIEFRLLFVALFGIGLLALGWRLRERQRVYALSVQGGGIGVLYLTIYASFGLYHLLPAGLAFGLLVVVTAAAGALAVLQDSRALAVLGIFGGFMAPVLVSTGSGNHVALFSYYALLDAAIVGIAWFKAWRVLNVLGFLFTFGVGTLWGATGYRPELFATTEPFLVLFTLMYLVIPVLFATRSAPQLKGFVDGTLMFGTPIVAFGLQSQLVADTEYGLAISAIALALFYVGLATYLYRSHREALRVLVEAQLALGLVFVTVAVPLALDARWTSAAWALQGAALVWLGFRQSRKLPLAAGLALQGLSGVAYAEQPFVVAEWPILNGYCLGALLLAFAGFFSGRLFDPKRERPQTAHTLPELFAQWLSAALLVWAAGWWFFAGFAEIDGYVNGSDQQFGVALIFVAVTSLLAMLAAARVDWPRLNWLALTVWPIGLFAALLSPFGFDHPAEELGWLAWPAIVVAMGAFLRYREAQFERLRGTLHTLSHWLVVALVVWEAHWLVGRVAAGVWPEAATLAVGTTLAWLTLRASVTMSWPFVAQARTYVQTAAGGVVVALVLATLALNLGSPGNAAPLPYLPILNPLELASVLVVIVLLKWLVALGEHNAPLKSSVGTRAAVAASGAWFLATMTVARAVHHWTGVPYDLDSLGASTTFQAALSIVWGVAGLAAMIVGTRATRRPVWLAGAVLMTVVVAKLFLVDLGGTGTWSRVVSFLGVGVLLLVVGYFAPVPPRAEPELRAAGH